MKARHLRIAGRVQGVGYRDWMVSQAQRLGVCGWVRNTGADSVEALVFGEEDAVEELVRACRRGPRAALVTDIEETLRDPPEENGSEPRGFIRLPSV
jgi:acylphosphatase